MLSEFMNRFSIRDRGIPMPRPDEFTEYEPHDDPQYDSREDIPNEDEPPTELME